MLLKFSKIFFESASEEASERLCEPCPSLAMEHCKCISKMSILEIKSFEELWNTKGLRDWGVEYYHLSFKDEDKIECLKNWCKILYNIEQNQFNEIIDTIRMGIAKSRQEFYRENPNAHISMVSPIQKLPTVIQNNFGNYIP